MSMSNQVGESKASDITKIANDSDWPNMDILSKNSFVIKSKKSTEDIDKIASSVQKTSFSEDVKIEETTQEDEQLSSPIVFQKPVDVCFEFEKQIVQPTVIPNVENTEQSEIVAKQVKNQITESKTTWLKQLSIGLTHLFFLKATSLLKPIIFVLQNIVEFTMALVHIAIPLLITLWLTQKVDFISISLNKETTIMYYGYLVVFYIACSCVWLFTQVLAAGIFSILKKSMHEVAKLGESQQ